MRKPQLQILDRAVVERIARCHGPQSAAAHALATADKLIARGDTAIFASDKANRKLIVYGEKMPTPTEPA